MTDDEVAAAAADPGACVETTVTRRRESSWRLTEAQSRCLRAAFRLGHVSAISGFNDGEVDPLTGRRPTAPVNVVLPGDADVRFHRWTVIGTLVRHGLMQGGPWANTFILTAEGERRAACRWGAKDSVGDAGDEREGAAA